MSRKVLIYTDSRGQHTPRGAPVHEVFAQRLAQTPGVEAEVVLCPMKWTTTVDFLEYLKDHPPQNYEWVVLYTGIVDWSPRPQPSAINDLYNNAAPQNLTNVALNTRDYSKKVVNHKKPAFDAIFGEAAMLSHLSGDFGVEYEGQPTTNMYGLEMAKASLLPKLAAIDNLIFINSNRFVPGWEGDFTRGRPANIALTEKYSELFREFLGPEKVIDLLQWGDEEVKKFTCDNLHLTREGSDWIYGELCKRMGLERCEMSMGNQSIDTNLQAGSAPIAPYGRPIQPPRALTLEERVACLHSVGLKEGDKLATLIVGIRLKERNDARTQNLLFLLSWIDYYYGDLFDVLLVEQDKTSMIDLVSDKLRSYVRHEFIFNPHAYNRGWGYNVAVRHFTQAKVVALMDTDVLTGGNFVQEIIDCYIGKYRVVSPYTNIYFTDAAEARSVKEKLNFSGLRNEKRVRKPTTITGGVVLFQRSLYEQLAGFEQYTDYGGEDRALDVTVMNHCSEAEVRMAPYIYVHLLHPSAEVDESKLAQILTHLKENFGCEVDRELKGGDFIHKNCAHLSKQKTAERIVARRSSYGDKDLYSSGRALQINGVYENETRPEAEAFIFPPEFSDLEDYEAKELYNAPEHDAVRLRKLYNLFKGKRCFIIGNGPSLNKHDLRLLEGEYVFAVNSFYYKTDETGFRPTFYVVEDTAVMKENIERIRAYEAPFKFFPTLYKRLHPEGENVYFFKMNRGFYEKSSPNYCLPRFSPDASKILYCGQSVTYINLQLAYFLGFTEVYLIGMDFDYVIPPEHQRRGDLIISTTDDPNHFHKDYFGKGKTWKDPKLERVAMNYRQAKLSFEAVGRKIYNATIGGRLEIFPRVDYDELLRGSAPRREEDKNLHFGTASAPDVPGVAGATQTQSSKVAEASATTFREAHAMPPMISVIVPVYNVQDYLEQCLSSLARQSDRNYEVLIIDDGSTDRSAEIIERFCKENGNFRVFRQENAGLGGARNSGLQICSGSFVTFVDSDDYVSADYVELLRFAQMQGNHDIVSASFARVSENGEKLEKQVPKTQEIPTGFAGLKPFQLVLGAFRPSISCARLYRRQLLIEKRLQFKSRMPHEDLCFTYKALYFAASTHEVAKEVYFYRQREGSLSKEASVAHVDALVEQWRDTEEFLRAINSENLDQFLAARRTLILTEGIASRVDKADSKVQAYFKEKIFERMGGLKSLLHRFKGMQVGDKYNPNKVEKLISLISQESSMQQTERNSTHAGVEQRELLFPHDALNLNSYRDKEIGEKSDTVGEMQGLYNKFKGKRCFIIGNGPSLNKNDLSLLEGEFVFAVNSFYYKTDETGFKPTFFVVEDNMVMKENIERIKNYDVPYKFFPTDYKALHPAGKNVYFFHMNQGFYQKSSPYFCVPRFSADASDVLYCGQSVTYINLQLAFYMGFTEVYLIGMDFDYVIPKEHLRNGNHIVSTTDDPNHFHKDYFGKGKTWKDPKLDRVAMNYRQAKLSFEAVGRKIYNATVGGRLEIFPRVDYERLLRDPATGKKRLEVTQPVPVSLGEGELVAPSQMPSQERAVPSEPKAAVGARPPLASHPAASSSTGPLPVVTPSVKAAPSHSAAPIAPVSADKPRTRAELRAARWAKLKRDPHAFFRDSHIPLFRPLHKLFKPATRKKWQVEVEKAERAAKPRFTFLPASRGTVALQRAALEAEARAASAALRQELLAVKRESQSLGASLRSDLQMLRGTITKLVEQRLVQERGVYEAKIEAIKKAEAAQSAALRAEFTKAIGAAGVALKAEWATRSQRTETELRTELKRVEDAVQKDLMAAEDKLAQALRLNAAADEALLEQIQQLRAVADMGAADAAENKAELSAMISSATTTLQQEVDLLRAGIGTIARYAAEDAYEKAVRVTRSEMHDQLQKTHEGHKRDLAQLLDSIMAGDSALRDELGSLKCAMSEMASEAADLALNSAVSAVQADLTARLHAVATDYKDGLAKALDTAVSTNEALRADIERLRAEVGDTVKLAADRAVQTAVATSGTAAAQSVGALETTLKAELSAAVAAVRSASTSLEAKLSKALEAAASGDAALRTEIGQLRATIADTAKQAVEQTFGTELATLKVANQKDRKLSNYSNSPLVRVHERFLSEADLEHIRKNWLRLLGLTIPNRQLSYMAHQICLAEDRCEGRMATTIHAAMLRTLALLCLQAKQVEILEIGTLFGIAAGTLYRAGVRAGRDVRLTLLDPLEGYYDQSPRDAQTGVPVTRETLAHNLKALDVPKEHYRVIQHLSSDPEAFKVAADRQYDFVLIDGDHSIEGVSADFEIYSSLVKPGGVLVFDDYDTTDWPAIKPFVDEYVRPNDDWLWIGGEWRTAIFRRKRRPMTAEERVVVPFAVEANKG